MPSTPASLSVIPAGDLLLLLPSFLINPNGISFHFYSLQLFSQFQPRNRMSSPLTSLKSSNSHIKKQIILSPKVEFSFIQFAILDIEIKKESFSLAEINPPRG
jgi:hypothetical protein